MFLQFVHFPLIHRCLFTFSAGPSSANAAHVQHAAEENRQALMLFAIVIFFLVFNTPRNFLNLYEVATFEQVTNNRRPLMKPTFP